MLKIKFDTHTHTVATEHAFSTFYENAMFAKKKGMDGFAITDHGPAMIDAPKRPYFKNLRVIPRDFEGLKILVGAEVNIRNLNGDIDLEDEILEHLDVVNASIHSLYNNNGATDNTSAYEAMILHPHVDIISHSGYPQYPYDYEYIVKLAKEHNKLIEINSHTFRARSGSIPNCRKIAELCRKHGTGIVVASDAHICTDVGNVTYALEMLEEIGFPEELVMNTTYDKFAEFMENRRNKKLMHWKWSKPSEERI